MSFEFSCDIGHIMLDIPHQLWEAVASDGNANTLVTRFLHNTPAFYANNLSRCYLYYLSPDFINSAFSAIGLVLFGLGLWHLFAKKNWPVLVFLLTAPNVPLFDLLPGEILQGGILYTAIILVILFGTKKVWDYFFS